MDTKITNDDRAAVLAELRRQNARLAGKTERGAEHSDSPEDQGLSEDAAYVAHDEAVRTALWQLRDFALAYPGSPTLRGLWEEAWFGLVAFYAGFADPSRTETLRNFGRVRRELAARGLVEEHVVEVTGDEFGFYVLTPHGRAVLDRAEAANADEHGPLTYEDLWTHDVLAKEGPLTWDRWREIAEDPSKGGYTTDFDTSAARLLGRLCVEKREDGTYASLRPPLVKPETYDEMEKSND